MNPLMTAALAGCATTLATLAILTSVARRSHPWYPAWQGSQLGLLAGVAVAGGLALVALTDAHEVLRALLLGAVMVAAFKFRQHLRSALTVPRVLWLLPIVLTAAGVSEPARGGHHVGVARASLRGVSSRGVRVRIRVARGKTVDDYRQAARAIAEGMRMTRIHVLHVRPGVVEIHLLRHDPLRHPVPLTSGRVANEVFIGVMESGEPLYLDLFCCASHVITQGQTRSGKSNFLQIVLRQLASHDAAVIAGCDVTGLLLAPFADHEGNEFRHTGTGNIRGHVDTLARIVREMDRRIATLVELRRDKLEAFGPGRPLIVVMLDEFSGLLEASRIDDVLNARRGPDRLAPLIESHVARLVAEGAKAGIRVIIGVQRAEANLLGGTTRSNIAVRLTFRVDNPDSVRLLHPDASDDLCSTVMQSQTGVALVSAPFLTQCSRIRLPCIGDTRQHYFEPILGLGTK